MLVRTLDELHAILSRMADADPKDEGELYMMALDAEELAARADAEVREMMRAVEEMEHVIRRINSDGEEKE